MVAIVCTRHSSHITQPLHVGAFGIFKREITKTLQSFSHRNGGNMPKISDMVNVIGDAFSQSFTPSQIKAFFQGAGLWPVDMHRALKRLRGCGSRRPALKGARSPLVDVPIGMNENVLASALDDRGVRNLQRQGHTIAGLRVGTVMFGGYLKHQGAKRRPSISRCADGITQEGLLTYDETIARYEEDEHQRRDDEQAKADRATAWLAKQVPREAAAAAAARGQGQGRVSGRAPVSGQGGGRDGYGVGAGSACERGWA